MYARLLCLILPGHVCCAVVRIRPDISLESTTMLRTVQAWMLQHHQPPVLRSEIMSVGAEGKGTLKDNFALVPRELADEYFGAFRAMDLCESLDTYERSCYNRPQSGEMLPTECILTHWIRHVRRVPELPRDARGNGSEAHFRMVRGDGSYRLLGGFSHLFRTYW
mmetsp:Transcript_45736/g.126985  ORF Transcript_45736/g.126985 Transcript_45736/m.126985 type:complete len:165 (-) Transcript_45736:326-820(-)